MSSADLRRGSAHDGAGPHAPSEMHELEAAVPAGRIDRADSLVSIMGPEFADLPSNPSVSIYSHANLDWRALTTPEKRAASPMRRDIRSGTASLIDYRPPGRSRGGPNPPRALAESHRYQPYRKAERILGTTLPTVEDVERPSTVELDSQPPGEGKVASAPEAPVAPAVDAGNTSPRSMRLPLTSNPVEAHGGRLSQLSPSAKRVSHVLPPISTQGPSNFSRKNIARTPYPASRSPGPRASPSSSRTAGASILYLRLRGRNQGPPRLASIVVPGRRRQEPSEKDEKEPGSPPSTSAFDDEQLFVGLREKYRSLRHPLWRLLSLRTLRSLDLVHFPANPAGPTSFGSIGTSQFRQPHLTASVMMEHLRRPKRGRGAYVWVDSAHDLSSELSEYSVDGPARLTVDFREGWSVLRIVLAWIMILVLGLGAGVVWTIFGVNGGGERGLRTVGARISTGALLSGVVLLLGWSVLGAWAVLSWLVL